MASSRIEAHNKALPAAIVPVSITSSGLTSTMISWAIHASSGFWKLGMPRKRLANSVFPCASQKDSANRRTESATGSWIGGVTRVV